MQIFTPIELARRAGTKYVGVLVAAKFARFVNEFPRDPSVSFAKKLTTSSLEELALGRLTYRLIRRRRHET
jgi:DNA-directed RNA polymerase subunit K/omega